MLRRHRHDLKKSKIRQQYVLNILQPKRLHKASNGISREVVATAFYSKGEWEQGKQKAPMWPEAHRPDIVSLLLGNRPTTF